MEVLISLNLGISIILVLISLQAHINFNLQGFKYIAFAGFFNGVLLILMMIEKDLKIENLKYYEDFFNILSSYYFFIVFFAYNKKNELKFHITGILVSALITFLIQLIPFDKKITITIFSIIAIFSLYKFIVKLKKEKSINKHISNSINISLVGICLYLALHFIPFISYIFNIEIDYVGYSGGIIAKFLMILGFYYFVINLLKIKVDRGLFAEELDRIIGLLFHELGPVILSFDSKIEELQSRQEVFRLNKQAQFEIKKIDYETNRLSAIYLSTYKRYLNEGINDSINTSQLVFDKKQIKDIEKHKINRKIFSVNWVVESAYHSFKTADFTIKNSELTYNESVRFIFEYGKNCYIRAVEPRLTQVLLNLFKNSFEAFPNGKGIIFIKTKVENETDLNGVERRLVVVEVEDNGLGIPENLSDEIFEEKFSTKPNKSKIKGYGLAQIKLIVHKEMGGLISFESPIKTPKIKTPINPGTRFILKFLWIETENKRIV